MEFSPTEMVACEFRSRTAVAPLERLKILLQVRSINSYCSTEYFSLFLDILAYLFTCKFCIV